MRGNGLFNKFAVPHWNNDNTFCFDPTMFALIAGCFFLVEICGFSACLIAACRWKGRKPNPIVQKRRHISIHYENSTDGSDVLCR